MKRRRIDVATKITKTGSAAATARLIENRRSQTRTILVVDDEEIVRNFSAAVLRDSGYSIVTSHDGIDAIEVFSSRLQFVEMLFTDIAMPRMGGIELANRLREWQPNLPVLFTSAHHVVQTIEESWCGRELDFIQKPFGVDELTGKVRELFTRAG